MFSRLSEKLQDVFKDLRGHGKISEKNVADALREIRMALLDADVHYQVARDFIAQVKEKALGEEVLRSVTPGQQVVKIFHDELCALLGGDAAPLDLSKPARILVIGLNGAGKTTSCAKLARWLKSQGKSPLLVALDLDRPAAIEQLAVLGEQNGIPVFRPDAGETDVLRATKKSLEWCRSTGGNVEIFDTAGRQEIDEALVQELVRDARGGAALSLRAVTGRPIKFAGVGEKIDQFEPFYPDRLAGRILGMGDVVSLVEKAAEAVTEEDARRMEEKLRTARFDLEDFLQQFKMIRKMGPLENLLGMIPGMDKVKSSSIDEKQLKRVEAIVLSMTPQERARPDILNARRRQRVARGSGTTVTEVNSLLLRFDQMRKMMRKAGQMKKLMARAGSNFRFPVPGGP